ncbi:hypothetical protein SmJEL517_g04232 [Synchytrium microbalum]|uniref:Protein kinase domain-containing protein n=1 Tax=Synchytrium microbalum TaxID=1806994 RepID=A0A507C3P9_9FUNG|nr:uncharacterized protein SmJEL517_g04232 [Synchytrium microbalum]TPX32734.1 hypothetical protein SmJEL517_g04232 [Synchytrium microbalum]
MTTSTSMQPSTAAVARTHLNTRHGTYELGKVIGQGASAKVRLATHTTSHHVCVIKSIKRPRLETSDCPIQPADVDKLWKKELFNIREASISMLLDHPNISRMFSAVLGEHHIYALFEHLPGQDLVDVIRNCGYIKPKRARHIFRQVLSAIDFAHRNSVIHRDIKLENIRYNAATGLATVLDFGFATFYDKTGNRLIQNNCGSPSYASPEIFANSFYQGPEIDIWSLGVCLYGMSCGTLPFAGQSFAELSASVKHSEISFPDHTSSDLIDLISRMLQRDPDQRITMDDILEHPWVSPNIISPRHNLNSQNTIPPQLITAVLGKSPQEEAEILQKVMFSERSPQRNVGVSRNPINKLSATNPRKLSPIIAPRPVSDHHLKTKLLTRVQSDNETLVPKQTWLSRLASKVFGARSSNNSHSSHRT